MTTARPEVSGRRIGARKKSRKTDAAGAIAAAKGKAGADTRAKADADEAPSALSLIKSPPRSQSPPQKSHHLDRRAGKLAVEGSEANGDDLLTTIELASWLGVSTQWLENGRNQKYGPKFTRLSERVVRYRRSDVLAWLAERVHQSTSEYINA